MTNSKTKTCQNCKVKFTIESEDFAFYKKIGVPEPTFCPECRMIRRFAFRNERSLYKRKCDFSGKDIITIYSPDNPIKVYTQKIWSSDKWDPMDYGKDYDFKKPFFEQFKELMLAVPWPDKFVYLNSVNCDYCIGVVFSKNCYLSLCNACENCLYFTGLGSNDCVDCFLLAKSELCYGCIDCSDLFDVAFGQYADNCINSAFLYDCRNCQNCFGCVNLRNKKYYIFNKPYTKGEYQKEIKKYDLGSFKIVQKLKKEFSKFKLQFPHKFARIYHSYNVLGNNVSNAKNCSYCFDTLSGGKGMENLSGVEDCKNIIFGGANLKDSYDIFDGGTNAELIYEGTTIGLNAKNIYFSMNIANSYNIQYSINCHSSSNLFACVGLRHKKYCILNKQYTKEEYQELLPRIKQQMNNLPYTDKKGRTYKYGEFFPPNLSLFGYNEGLAIEHSPLTKEQALKHGYNWHDRPKSEHRSTIKAKDLPDNIKDVDNSILKEAIECANNGHNCAGPGLFRIISQELKFYKERNLPLPRLCPDCRYRERIKQRSPFRLWKRQCMKKGCKNTFQTTYAPERKEIVYCEECYNKEIG